jgi:hypothetical protein
VSDRIRDSSVSVDPDTHQTLPGQITPASPDEAPQLASLYQLELLDGQWKVVASMWKVVTQ